MKDAVESLPASWYCDRTIYQIEREKIFAKQWIYAANLCELPGPGDYITTEIAGYPIVIIKQDNDEISAFHNVCRHRAAPLLDEPQGKLLTSSLSCKYHGWTYNTTGELVSAPYFDCSKWCDRDKYSLFSVKTAVFNGLIFVNLSEESASFFKTHAELVDKISSSDSNFKEYTFHSKMVREGNFNWKVWIEGYQECYHCPTIHPVFLKDFLLQKYNIDNHQLFSSHSCERRVESSSGAFSGLWLWVYPNLGLPVYEPAYYTLIVNPLDVDRTQLTYTFHFRNGASEETINHFLEFVDQITKEDITICEAVQKNLAAGIFKNGYLNPVRENGVVYFQSLIWAAVGGITANEQLPLLGEQTRAVAGVM